MKKLAIIATNGSYNSLVSLATLLMSAAVSEIAVRVFFRDEAVLKLSRQRVGEMNLSEGYRGVEAEIRANLEKFNLGDLQKLFQEAKGQGDIKLYACTSSMAVCGLSREDLIPEIDEPRGLTSFLLEEVSDADKVLSF